MNKPIVIRGATVVDPAGPVLLKAQITVDEGKILAVKEGSADPVHEDAIIADLSLIHISEPTRPY